jgi:hypothetical protein
MRWSAIALLFVLLPGCGRQQHAPRQFIVLVDTSGSIEVDAEEECINAILKLAEKMERGDKLSVIPVTGDADLESAGRVLRFQKPVNRTAYDADLLGFSKQVKQSIIGFRTWAIAHPTAQTDIFGGIRMALEEFQATPDQQQGTLVILSDFIEDDGTVDFKFDQRLATPQAAVKYATEEAKHTFVRSVSARASMGLLRSRDLRGLKKERREAIKQFWRQYLKSLGMESSYASDGISLLSNQNSFLLCNKEVAK